MMGVEEGNIQVMGGGCRNDHGKLYNNCSYGTYYFQHAHFIPLVGVGKRGAY